MVFVILKRHSFLCKFFGDRLHTLWHFHGNVHLLLRDLRPSLNRSLNNLDIAPDLVTESVVVLSGHTEVGSIATCLKRSSELKSPGILLIRLNNFIDWLRCSTNLITVSLNEQGILRPLILTIISESPCLSKGLTGMHYILVTKALFNKASKVFLRSSFCRGLLRFRLLLVFLALDVVLLIVLTDKLYRGLLREADLEQGVRMLLTSFAFLTDIIVVTNRAHVSDTLDRINIAHITDKLFMDHSILPQLLFSQVVFDLFSKAMSAHLLDLGTYYFKNIAKHVAAHISRAIAFTARQSLLINLRTFTFEARDLFSVIF